MLKLEDFKAVKMTRNSKLLGGKEYTQNIETGSTKDVIYDDGLYVGPEGSWYTVGCINCKIMQKS